MTKANWNILGALVVVVILMALTGCIEDLQVPAREPASVGEADLAPFPDEPEPPTWGTGDPPASWTETFGNDNGSRMDFAQMKALSEVNARIKRLEEFCWIGEAE